MSEHKFPIRYALLVAALMQLFPAVADAAKKDDDADEALVCEDCPDDSGKTGWLEVGVGLQSNDAYHFGRYTGYEDNGATLNAAGEYRYRGKDNGGYVNIKAEDLGLEARDLVLEAGRQGKYDVAVEYDQVPNFREQDARSPFRALGGGTLGLPATWVPGGTTSTMPTLASSLIATPLQTERDRLGVKFTYVADKNWELSGHFRREKKDGIKDQGATIGFSQSVVLPVPVNYQTDDFGVAVGYKGENLQAQVAYDGSLFNNDFARIGWDNPYSAFPNSPTGQMSDAPDNEFHQISALLGYKLSESTRLGAKFARGRMTQNEAFLPYTVNPAIVSGALPASNLDGEVDTTLAKVDIYSRLSSKLRLDASYTYSDRDNKTSVNTYDYVVTDLMSGGLRQNRPYSFEQRVLRTKLGYRLPGDADLSVGFDDDQMSRTYQQVEETKDKTLWGKLKINVAENVDTTLKLSHSNRDASPYTPQADEHSLMRVHNLADRDRNKAGVEVMASPNEKLSVGFDLEYLADDYSNMYLGLREAKGMTANVNATYAFNPDLSATAYYNHERLSSDQAGSTRLGFPVINEPWLASDSNVTQTLGLGLNWVAVPEKLNLGVDLVYADYTGKIRFDGAPALPELGATLTGLGVHGVYKVKENLSVRAGYQYEHYKESDWAKSGDVDTISTLLGLGTAPQDYNTHLVTLTLRYDFK